MCANLGGKTTGLFATNFPFLVENEINGSYTLTMFGSVSCDCCQSSVIQLVNKVSRGLVVWRSGIVVRHINEVTLRRARLGLGWVTIFGPVYHPTRLTQPCILLGSLHRVPTVTGWGKGGHVTSVG